MLRKVLATVLLLGALSGCTVPARTCTSNADCQSNGGDGLCDTQVKLCYAGNKEIDNSACTPACAPYEACTGAKECVPRYSALVVTPGDGGLVGKGAVPVRAELLVDTTRFSANFPETLRFSAVREDGGTGGTFDAVSTDAGVYTTQWTPAGDGVFLLTAAYPTDGGPRTTVHLTVDATPPAFTVTPRSPDAGGPSGGTTYVDPNLPDAWRRDQVATVEVRTNEPHLDPSTVTVVLGTDGGSAPAVNVTQFASTESCDAGFCGLAQVNLWVPPFNGFNGPMTLVAQGTDTAGNTGTSLGSVNVTRWKWRYDIAGATITAAPALGNTGAVYVGTTNGSDNDGQMLALSPGGRLLWSANAGAVVASPAVGNVQDGGTERVYVAHKKASTNRIGFYDSTDGGFTTPCSDFTFGSVSVQSSLAVAQVSAGDTSETAYGVYTGRTGGTLFAIRPDVKNVDPQVQCPTLPAVGDVSAPGTMLAAGNAVVFGTNDGTLKSFALSSSGALSGLWSTSAQWTQSLGTLRPMSLAAADGRVWGGGNDGSNSKLFQVPLSGTQAPTYFSTAAPMWNVSIGGSNGAEAVVGLDSTNANNNKLFVLETGDGGTRTIDTPNDILKGAPVWGARGYVYTSGATSGTIQARQPLENVAWQFDTGSIVEASMNLDCNRLADGGVASGVPTGVLYAASKDGKVFAIVVDSPGLDPDAPWPKYKHDARNTGNPNTPISSCP